MSPDVVRNDGSRAPALTLRPSLAGVPINIIRQDLSITDPIRQEMNEDDTESGWQSCYPLSFCMEGTTISDYFINEQIRDKEVRVIGENGDQLGIMSSRDAQKLADDAGLDLVKIAPTATPPVCRIVDYGKFKYEQIRKEKEAKKKQQVTEIKEIRLSPNIDTNDLNTKTNAIRKFIEKGNKVKVTLRFRGREMAHMAQSKHILDDLAESLAEVAVIEKAPKVEGRSMIMFLSKKR